MTEQADALVIFGATGDLARKKIFPALQALVKRGALTVPVVGVARPGFSLEQLRQRAKESVTEHGGLDAEAFPKLAQLLRFVDGEYSQPDTYEKLRSALGAAKLPVHYLAIPPSMFGTVVSGLGRAGCAEHARVIVEKPFGRDVASAQALNQALLTVFPERTIYRIDHYLGKEPVQNLSYFRFSNSFVEPILNRNYVQSVQITMAEKIGIEGRGRLYEETGAIRDVIQNHMLQLVASVAMDAPTGRDLDAVRDEKARLFRAIRPVAPSEVVRGQVQGYRAEKDVAPDSTVETFAAMRLHIDNWRWASVPFYIRAGKSLPTSVSEVLVQLKTPPYSVFGESLCDPDSSTNYIRFRLGPDVAIAQGVRVKLPGEAMRGEEVELVATQHASDHMDAYARLLGDAIKGDATLFAREDSVEAQWRVVEPILGNASPIHEYAPGTWGPAEASRLTQWADPKPSDRKA
jgi:glucose-6-phosphate 1-dehydrogenase